jgi:PAS domain S-box-containing protein
MATLRTYLVTVILLATVPIALLMSWQIWRDVQDEQRRMEEGLMARATALAEVVERELASSIDALTILSYQDALQRADVPAFRHALAAYPQLRQSWHGAFLADSDGRLLFDSRDAPDAAPAGVAPEIVRSVVAQHRPAVSNLVAQAAPTPYTTAVAVPVVVGGEVRYVLGAWIDAVAWQQLLDRSAPPPNGFTSVFDAEHRLIARTLAPAQAIGQPLPAEVVRSMNARASGTHRTVVVGGDESYGAWQKVPLSGWGVGVGLLAAPIDAAQGHAVAQGLGFAAACLLLGVTLALLAARRLALPLQRLAHPGTPGKHPLSTIRVREVALLRDALQAAALRDEAALERLQTKADEFETLFASSPIGLAFAQDPQCRVVLHNAAMDQLFGALAAHVTGTVQVLHRGRLLERAEQPLQRAASLGESVPLTELEVRSEGSASTWVLANAVPLRGPAGQPRGAIGAVVDITEAKLAEARLRHADRRLRESQHLINLAQEAGHVGFFQYQFEPDVLTWTPGLAKLFGFQLAEAASPLDEWLRRIDRADRARVEHALRRLVEKRQERETVDYRVTHADGNVRWLSSRVLLSFDDDGRALQMIGVTVDMTEAQRVERERAALVEREQSARLEAEAANRAKDEFLAMLGHELRNPLSAIASAVEVLNRVDAGAEIAADARHIIARQTRHLAHMMDDLLDVARVISGKVLLSKTKLNLAQLVTRAVATLQVTGEAREHTLSVHADDAWVEADTTRIEQVTTNLLTNALKYTPAGGRIEIDVGNDAGQAVLRVKDSGIGIAATLLPRIFDLFVQGERTLERRAGGLGIGLTLVRRLVQLHGGTIEAHSAPGQGSLFTVRLAAVAAPSSAHEGERERVPESRRRRVGIVEDNEDALAALRSLLELDGHSVWSESDGLAGLSAVLAQRPDVAVIDIGLPGIDGYELAKRSRAGGYAGRMIALSGYGQDRDVQQALKSGFDAHLVKPVDPTALRRAMADE